MTLDEISAGHSLSAPVRRSSPQCAGEPCQCASTYKCGAHNTPGADCAVEPGTDPGFYTLAAPIRTQLDQEPAPS